MNKNNKCYTSKIHHYWMNNPNSCNQICTCCGLRRIKTFKNYKMTIKYITQDGVEHDENQPCKSDLICQTKRKQANYQR